MIGDDRGNRWSATSYTTVRPQIEFGDNGTTVLVDTATGDVLKAGPDVG